MQEVTEKVDYLEKIVRDIAYEQMQTQRSIRELTEDLRVFKGEMKDFKDEMKDFKDEMKDFKDEMSEFKDGVSLNIKQMNKKWGELANKMGTFAEDIAAPNIPYVAEKYFGCSDYESFTVRSEKRSTNDPSQKREFDAIAVYPDKVFLNETKSTPRIEYVNNFIEFYQSNAFFEYFPEYQEKKLVPIFSSMYLTRDIVNLLSKNKIYAMAMTEETMDLLNYEDVVS